MSTEMKGESHRQCLIKKKHLGQAFGEEVR